MLRTRQRPGSYQNKMQALGRSMLLSTVLVTDMETDVNFYKDMGPARGLYMLNAIDFYALAILQVARKVWPAVQRRQNLLWEMIRSRLIEAGGRTSHAVLEMRLQRLRRSPAQNPDHTDF